jgi:uncharacterized protein YggT (Ycf19 family)
MAEQKNLAIDEAERIQQHESIKGSVRKRVHEDIAREADETPVDRNDEAALAGSLKRQAVREVASTESELARGRAAARTSQVIDYLFYVAYGIIGMAIALEAIGARESAGFKQFVDTLAWPLLAPFRGIMPDPGVGDFRLMLSYLVALVVYVLVHVAINGVLRIVAQRKVAI